MIADSTLLLASLDLLRNPTLANRFAAFLVKEHIRLHQGLLDYLVT